MLGKPVSTFMDTGLGLDGPVVASPHGPIDASQFMAVVPSSPLSAALELGSVTPLHALVVLGATPGAAWRPGMTSTPARPEASTPVLGRASASVSAVLPSPAVDVSPSTSSAVELSGLSGAVGPGVGDRPESAARRGPIGGVSAPPGFVCCAKSVVREGIMTTISPTEDRWSLLRMLDAAMLQCEVDFWHGCRHEKSAVIEVECPVKVVQGLVSSARTANLLDVAALGGPTVLGKAMSAHKLLQVECQHCAFRASVALATSKCMQRSHRSVPCWYHTSVRSVPCW